MSQFRLTIIADPLARYGQYLVPADFLEGLNLVFSVADRGRPERTPGATPDQPDDRVV